MLYTIVVEGPELEQERELGEAESSIADVVAPVSSLNGDEPGGEDGLQQHQEGQVANPLETEDSDFSSEPSDRDIFQRDDCSSEDRREREEFGDSLHVVFFALPRRDDHRLRERPDSLNSDMSYESEESGSFEEAADDNNSDDSPTATSANSPHLGEARQSSGSDRLGGLDGAGDSREEHDSEKEEHEKPEAQRPGPVSFARTPLLLAQSIGYLSFTCYSLAPLSPEARRAPPIFRRGNTRVTVLRMPSGYRLDRRDWLGDIWSGRRYSFVRSFRGKGKWRRTWIGEREKESESLLLLRLVLIWRARERNLKLTCGMRIDELVYTVVVQGPEVDEEQELGEPETNMADLFAPAPSSVDNSEANRDDGHQQVQAASSSTGEHHNDSTHSRYYNIPFSGNLSPEERKQRRENRDRLQTSVLEDLSPEERWEREDNCRLLRPTLLIWSRENRHQLPERANSPTSDADAESDHLGGFDGAGDERSPQPNETNKNQTSAARRPRFKYHVASPVIPAGREPIFLAKANQALIHEDAGYKALPHLQKAEAWCGKTRIVVVRALWGLGAIPRVESSMHDIWAIVRRYSFVQNRKGNGQLMWVRKWKDGSGGAWWPGKSFFTKWEQRR